MRITAKLDPADLHVSLLSTGIKPSMAALKLDRCLGAWSITVGAPKRAEAKAMRSSSWRMGNSGEAVASRFE